MGSSRGVGIRGNFNKFMMITSRTGKRYYALKSKICKKCNGTRVIYLKKDNSFNVCCCQIKKCAIIEKRKGRIPLPYNNILKINYEQNNRTV